MTTSKSRRSARVILLDASNRVLLVLFRINRSTGPASFWATPGGSVEPGETDAEAASRELSEELGLRIPITGPVHIATSKFEHKAALVENTDVFFIGYCDQNAPKLDPLTAEERRAMRQIKWWSVEEIENCDETIFPTDLAAVLRANIGPGN